MNLNGANNDKTHNKKTDFLAAQYIARDGYYRTAAPPLDTCTLKRGAT